MTTRAFTTTELARLNVPPDSPDDVAYSDALLADEFVTTLKYSQQRRCVFRTDDDRTYAVTYETDVDSGDYEHGPGPENHGWYGETVEAVEVEQRAVAEQRWVPVDEQSADRAHPVPAGPARKLTTVPFHVIAVDLDGGQLDCCDDDPVHAWVSVTAWSGRRAVLVQGTQFATAAGCAPEDLPGRFFLAELDLHNPPPFEAEPGERIDFPGLRPAPDPPAEWMGAGLRQTAGGPVGAAVSAAAAEELRAAAQKLRESAERSRRGTGPAMRSAIQDGTRDLFGQPVRDPAVMHPGVALALAAWLEPVAQRVERIPGHAEDEPEARAALAVARAIGGGQ